MILFKPEHVAAILAGRKTQTRRLGARRWRVGSVHACYTRPPFAQGGAEPFCRVEVRDVRRERLDAMTAADVYAEGYDNHAEYCDALARINGVQLAGDTEVWVVAFALVNERGQPDAR